MPDRVSGRGRAAAVELAVGIVAPLVLVLLRAPLSAVAGDRAPYATTFVAIALAAVLAGWRSGLIATVVGQVVAWYLIIAPAQSFALPSPQIRGGLVIATICQLIMLLIIALYQREIDKNRRQQERSLEILSDALREIDHRTKNNYQTVLAMIRLQAQRSKDGRASVALQQVADRIDAIARASQQLAVHSRDLDSVRLDDHLCGLVAQIERGLSREEIKVECDVEEVTASSDKATSISIIVNELVTNAIKHAFNGEGSGSVWVTGRAGHEFELIIADDGRGIRESTRAEQSGLGSRLVESFARQINAKHEVSSSERGTTHRLLIPSLV